MIRLISRKSTNNIVSACIRKPWTSTQFLQQRFQSSQSSTELFPSTPILKFKQSKECQTEQENESVELVTPRGLEKYWTQVRSGLSQIRKLADQGKIDLENMTKITIFLSTTYNNFKTFSHQKENDLSRNSRLVLIIVLRDLTYKVLDGKIKVNETAFYNLLKLYSLLGLDSELVYIWSKSLSSSELEPFSTSSPIFELVLPLLLRDEFDYETLNKIYQSITKTSSDTNDMKLNMIPIYLTGNETNKAVTLFSELSISELEVPVLQKGFNNIVRSCKDLDTTEIFIEKAQQLQIPIDESTINHLLDNISNDSFKEIESLWNRLITTHDKSINNPFIRTFFEKYDTFSPEAFEQLKNIIKKLESTSSLNEWTVSSIVYKSSIWRSSDTFHYLLKLGNSNFSNKSLHLIKAYLSATGYVDIENGIVLDLFREMIKKSKSYRMTTEIWDTIRDATVNSPYLFSFNEPNRRIDVYFKLWKICSPYLNNLDAFKSYIYEDIKLNPKYSKIYINLPLILVDFEFSEIQKFKKNASIGNYMG